MKTVCCFSWRLVIAEQVLVIYILPIDTKFFVQMRFYIFPLVSVLCDDHHTYFPLDLSYKHLFFKHWRLFEHRFSEEMLIEEWWNKNFVTGFKQQNRLRFNGIQPSLSPTERIICIKSCSSLKATKTTLTFRPVSDNSEMSQPRRTCVELYS